MTATALLDARPANWPTVEAAGAGDREAFGLIWQTYRWRIFNYLRYRTHDADLAEDLTSDTFVRALTHLGTVRWQGHDIGAWLTTIARNLLIDWTKSAAHRTTVPTGDHHPTDVPFPAGVPDLLPLDVAIGVDTSRIVFAAVDRLTGPQRQVIALRFLEERSVAETGGVMGLNDGAVKALTYRATRALARLLEGVDL